MYIQSELAKATQDERLRIAARDQLRAQVRAARRAGYRGSSAGRLPALRILRVLRVRRAAQAY